MSVSDRTNAVCCVQNVPHLRHLNVAWNQLCNIHNEVSTLRRHAANLTNLDLRYNPWQKVSHLFLAACFQMSTMKQRLSCDDCLEDKREDFQNC